MAVSLFNQILGISYQRDDRGNESLVYAPTPLVTEGRAPPDPTYQAIKYEVLLRHLEDVRRRVEELTVLARLGESRGSVGIEPVADAVANYVFPRGGLVRMIEPALCPQFDIVYDAAALIPWEVLEEKYVFCSCREPVTYVRRETPHLPTTHCQFCGGRMSEAGGKLAVDRHLSHLVRGGQPPTKMGQEFLIVDDPTGDLSRPENDPRGDCRRHVDEIQALLRERGYQVHLLRSKNATTRRFLAALENPALVGLYYFGHGFFPRDGDQGCLVCSDGSLFAGEIENMVTQLRFAFVNACEGAAAGRTWTLDKRFRSIGWALARGGPAKNVIAPLWPVVNTQAAAAATQVFRALLKEVPIGVALQGARRQSLTRYEQGVPDISWMAYRLFGDPGRLFPCLENRAQPRLRGNASSTSRLFDGAQNLDTEQFGFSLVGPLLRAAKRRELQGREQITLGDLLAGVLRTGDLTRHAFRCLNEDPDALYGKLLEHKDDASVVRPRDESSRSDDAPGGPEDKSDRVTRLRAWLARWIVRRQDEFDGSTLEVLRRAEDLARHRAAAATISEHDLLDAMTAPGSWGTPVPTGFPSVERMRTWLATRQKQQFIDENGRLILAPLTPLARRVIDGALVLSQQRGAPRVLNRLLLASFVQESDSYAAQVARSQGVDPAALSTVLIAGTESRSPKSYLLSPETGRHSIVPLLECCHKSLPAERGAVAITEAQLFRAFCEVAPDELRTLLASFPGKLRLDLSQVIAERVPQGEVLATTSPFHATQAIAFDETARLRDSQVHDALFLAQEYALVQGHSEVSSIHLAAGLASVRTPWLVRALARHQIKPERFVTALLRVVVARTRSGPDMKIEGWSKESRRIVEGAMLDCQQRGGAEVTDRDLWRVILSDKEATVARVLRHWQLFESLCTALGVT